MKKGIKVLAIYLASLFLISLLLSWLNLSKFDIYLSNSKIRVNPMLLVTIAGGIIALKNIFSDRSFKTFLIIYCCLWVVRFFLIYIGVKIGAVTIFNKLFHFDLIIVNYYATVSRLETPLPFMIFWLINYLFIEVLPARFGVDTRKKS